MSSSDDNLLLHLKLDKIIKEGNTKKVIDVSSKKNNGTIQGNPLIVADEIFGSCLSFDGESDYVNCENINIGRSSFSIEFWAKRETNGEKSEKQVVIGGNNLFQSIGFTNNGYFANFANAISNMELKLYKTHMHTDWHHWAVVWNGTSQCIYMDGKQLDGLYIHLNQRYNGNENIGTLCIGGSFDERDYFFQGKIAHVRIYNKALSPEEITRDMNDDITHISHFKNSYPLDFNLYEADTKEPVIFIENSTQRQELILEIINNLEQDVTLEDNRDLSKNYHFELRFRAGTLSLSSLPELDSATSKHWKMTISATQAKDTVSLYFLKTKKNQLRANSTEKLTIKNINALGSARTTRVELLCPKLNCYRGKSMSIVGHRGNKNIPLHVGFVGSNRILNDGKTEQTLILQIANVLKDQSIHLNPKSQGNEASKFIISFDVKAENVTKEWALLESGQLENVHITRKETQIINSGKQAESPEWIITFDNDEIEIKADQPLQIKLSGITSSLPSGHTNLYVHYENIPGYWDGTFICTIEKSPIMYMAGNVGIGTIDPGANKLKVKGDTEIAGKLSIGTIVPDTNTLKVQGNAEITSKLSVDTIDPGTKTLKVQGNAEITGTLKADKIEGAFAIGMVIMWCGDKNKVPDGWVLCDGIQIPGLTVIVPDLRGRFALGSGEGGFDELNNKLSSRQLGGKGGLEEVTLNENEMPMHNHNGKTKEDGQHKHKLWQHIRSFVGKSDDKDRPLKANEENAKDFSTKDGEGKHTHDFTTSNAGGNKAHTNMPPFYVLAYIMYTGCPKDTQKK